MKALKMRGLNSRMVFAVTLLGMLTILTVSGSIYFSGITNTSMQNLDDHAVTLHTNAVNNALLWNVTWGGTDEDCGYGVAVDSNDSIYCTGETTSFGAGDKDLALVKFAPNGTRLWNLTWGGSNYDLAKAVAVDTNGSIYCTGITYSFGNNLALVKFAPNGTKLWNVTWGGPLSDEGRSVAVDANGSIYCFGITMKGSFNSDWALVKFAPNGTKLWNTSWGGAEDDAGFGLAVDADGYIYCTGNSFSFGSGMPSLALVKYAPNGTQIWNTTWGDAGSHFGYAVTVDANGSIYVVGHTLNYIEGNYNGVLIKFTSSGTELWHSIWGGYGDDHGSGVALDANGSIYCSAYIEKPGASTHDLAVFKYSQNGKQLWNATWGGASGDLGYGIALDTSGLIYCVGGTNSFGAGNGDFVLVKFQYKSTGGGPPGGIPSFELCYLLIGLLALLGLAHWRRFFRTTA
jgi:uncharacterized delta-60 repeat protein/MYXO-CTERM domain-containing protein